MLVSGMAKYVAIIVRWEKSDGVVTFCAIVSYWESNSILLSNPSFFWQCWFIGFVFSFFPISFYILSTALVIFFWAWNKKQQCSVFVEQYIFSMACLLVEESGTEIENSNFSYHFLLVLCHCLFLLLSFFTLQSFKFDFFKKYKANSNNKNYW